MTELYRVDRVSENPNSHIKWRSEQIARIIELYEKELISIKKIAADYFCVHENSIKKVLQRNNIHIRDNRESYCLDGRKIDIFHDIITEEQAYWVGFLAADGCISGNYLSCSLQLSDIGHLEKLRKFLGCSTQISIVNSSACRFQIGCKEISDDLKELGVTERKSLTLDPPDWIKEELVYDWIRGFFDGDGGISLSSNGKRAQMYFTSTKRVLEWIIKILQLTTEPFLEHRCTNTYRISINGRQQVKSLLDLLYHNGEAKIFLDRKFQKYKYLLSLLQQ